MILNKKGNLITMMILLTLSVVVAVTVLIPQVRLTDTAQGYAESFVHDNSPLAQTFTLSNTDIVTFAIPGLAVNTNYTLDISTGELVFLAGNATDAQYNSSYTYESVQYLDDASSRAIAALIILGVLLGLGYFAFKSFGMI